MLLFLVFIMPAQLSSRELRTPWSLDRWYMHAPICDPTECDFLWHFNAGFAGLRKQSFKAFKNRITFDTDPSLAGIVFGKNSFTALDAFAPGTTSTNPFLVFSRITPIFDYSENTAYFETIFDRAIRGNENWRAGFRANIPFRALKVGLENGCCQEKSKEEIIDELVSYQNERVQGSSGVLTINNAFAFRLDFLASLYEQTAGITPFKPLINFHNTGKVNNPITIHDIDITNGNNNPVSVIERSDGTVPQGVYSASQSDVNTMSAIPANGFGLSNNARARFVNTIDYTPLASSAAKSQLWVVPTYTPGATPGQDPIVPDARTIENKVQQLLQNLTSAQTSINFLEAHGMDFNTNTFVGIGDMNFEFYSRYAWCDFFGEGIFGVKIPTGVKVKNPQKPLTIFTTGNNRHFETRLGGVGEWQPKTWFLTKWDFFWCHAFSNKELVAAPFAGATVKNIGPTISSHIYWDYFFGHIQSDFFVPANPQVGLSIGYEWYVKTHDHVSFDQKTAVDFFGNVKPLDPAVLEERTEVVSNKVRTELFHQGENWELFGGWTHVFAGANAPKETDWHIGFIAYF